MSSGRPHLGSDEDLAERFFARQRSEILARVARREAERRVHRRAALALAASATFVLLLFGGLLATSLPERGEGRRGDALLFELAELDGLAPLARPFAAEEVEPLAGRDLLAAFDSLGDAGRGNAAEPDSSAAEHEFASLLAGTTSPRVGEVLPPLTLDVDDALLERAFESPFPPDAPHGVEERG